MTETTETVKTESKKVEAAAVAPAKTAEPIKGDYIAVVQVRGLVGVKKPVKDTLKMIGLTRVNQCVVLKNNASLGGMLLKIKDYATYGPVSKAVITKIINARGIEYQGRSQDNKGKYTYSCFEFDGKKYKRCFRLNPPRKGYGRNGIKRSFNTGGALGTRGEKIADLIERML
ncbi:50S ribosomal protein L30 [archaeon]|jgi:large subunit ribosomal protein L30|nr:50S ribosomal protein L30 [archaeon]MBT6761746.1 50S ribosomal protein L30 [archaeon]